MESASQFLKLRSRIHEGEFRFDLTEDLWKTNYDSNEESDEKNILKVTENGELKGYAVYSLVTLKEAKAYRILEICAQDKNVFVDLVNRVIERGLKEGIDFIYLKEKKENHDKMLEEKGFFAFAESVIMVALLDPEQFFSSVTQEIQQGKIIKLQIESFNPLYLRIGKEGVQIASDEKPVSTLTMDGKTFLRLLFGRTSFSREFVRRRVRIDNMLHFSTASHLFKLLKQDRWYIPQGDWL